MTDLFDQFLDRGVFAPGLEDLLAAGDDDEAVTDPVGVEQVMGDENARDALFSKCPGGFRGRHPRGRSRPRGRLTSARQPRAAKLAEGSRRQPPTSAGRGSRARLPAQPPRTPPGKYT